MNIKNIEFKSKVFLAPMAGVTDKAFREIAVSYGAGYSATEMISAKGIIMHNKNSLELLNIEKSSAPIAIQLFGEDGSIIAQAAEIAKDFNPAIIDINMGCPAPKIVNNGAGAALMKDIRKAADIVKTVVSHVDIPVTVKIRKGWDDNNVNAVDFAKAVENAGAAAIAVHGRTRQQMYSGCVDYEIIAKVKNAVSIPVIGNGDITDISSAVKMLENTNCDAIMVGRGAMGNPWIFQEINAYLNDCTIIPRPSVIEKMTVMLKQIKNAVQYKGEYVAMKEARSQASYYTKGLPGGAKYRRSISSVNTYDDLVEIVHQIIKENTQ